MPTSTKIQKYYVAVAHQFEELADYVREHPELDQEMSEELKNLASEILEDVTHRG